MARVYATLVRGSIANPVVVFLLLWGMIFLLYSMRYIWFPEFDFLEISFNLGGYYLSFLAAFFIGGLAALSLRMFFPRGSELISPVTLAFRTHKKSTPPIVVFFSYAALLASILAIYQTGYSITDFFTIGGQIRESLTLDYNPRGSLASLMSSYAAYIALPISYYVLLVERQRSNIWPYFPSIALFITSIISLSKYGVIMMAVIALSVWIIYRDIRFREIYTLAKPLILLFVIMLFLFISIFTLRAGSEARKDDKSILSSIGFVMFMYGVGHVNTFSNYYYSLDVSSGQANTKNAGFGNVDMDRERAPGEITFSGFYRFLYWIGLREVVAYTRYEGLEGYNTSSILRNYIDDFGIKGAILANFIAGFLCQLLFLVFTRKTLSNISFLSLVLTFVVFTPIHSLFNFIFFYISLLAVPFVGRVRLG